MLISTTSLKPKAEVSMFLAKVDECPKEQELNLKTFFGLFCDTGTVISIKDGTSVIQSKSDSFNIFLIRFFIPFQ
jgi:hypothetical protein